jgi:ferric-dicitrate binding protein FerR (iron transport regulator)
MPDTARIETELREQYPLPSPMATERARAAIRQAAEESRQLGRRPHMRRRPRRRSILIMAGVLIALVAAGVAIAVSLLNVTPPRFQSAPGWHVGSTRTH